MKAIIVTTTKLVIRSGCRASFPTSRNPPVLCQFFQRIQCSNFLSTEKSIDISMNEEKPSDSSETFTDLLNKEYYKDKDSSPVRKRNFAFPRLSSQQELFLFENFKALNGHLDIKQSYRIPAVVEWPDWSHNFPLGSLVARMRHFHKNQQIRPSTFTLYTEMGFIWDHRLHKQENFVQALQSFEALYGHHQVPAHFVVPSDPYWPKTTWGVKLGTMCADLRSKENRYFYLRDRLKEMGYTYAKIQNNFTPVFNALVTYKAKYGDLHVPRNYIIANEDESYPLECRGLYLGEVVNNIRNHNAFLDFKAQLLAIGFHFEHMKYFDFEKIFRAIQRYKLIHGHVRVPATYIVSAEVKDFDEEFWGMKLGRVVKSIRLGGTYHEYRKYFTDLGLKVVSWKSFLSLFSASSSSSSVFGSFVLTLGFLCAVFSFL